MLNFKTIEILKPNSSIIDIIKCYDYKTKNGKVKMMCLGQCILEEHTPYGIGNYKAIISSSNDEIYQKIKKSIISGAFFPNG